MNLNSRQETLVFTEKTGIVLIRESHTVAILRSTSYKKEKEKKNTVTIKYRHRAELSLFFCETFYSNKACNKKLNVYMFFSFTH